jgi:hypothetical protein
MLTALVCVCVCVVTFVLACPTPVNHTAGAKRAYRSTAIGMRAAGAREPEEAELVRTAEAAATPESARAGGAVSEAEEGKETLIEETETVSGQAETLPFQSETAKLLRIVAHSLYTDKEVRAFVPPWGLSSIRVRGV